MIQFRLHTPESAPRASRPLMAATQQGDGSLTNMYRILAEAPAALTGFERLRATFADSSLTPLEQEVVYHTVAHTNQCHYCTAHIGMFEDSEQSRAATAAIHDERAIPDARLQALRRLVATMAREQGWVPESLIASFLEAGYTHENVLDVICGIALVTMSTYTNHIAATPIEAGTAPPRLAS